MLRYIIMAHSSITELGTILGIWAHPDDETWCSGGIMAAAATNGQRVVCVTATHGDAGQYDRTRFPGDLATTRQKELAAALAALGVTEHRWLEYKDGYCHEEDDDIAAAKIARVIEEIQPQTILTFGPDGLTGHPDHQAVGRWTSDALEHAKLAKPARLYYKVESRQWFERIGRALDDKYNFYFMTDHPLLLDEKLFSLSLHLSPEIAERKLAALKAHASQTEKMFAELSPADLQAIASFEGFQPA
jgi:LmbE family N-acetylglucosaminyl deacetylase